MNVSLTRRLEAFVRSKVASGLYNNASEVVREALRLLAERDRSASAPVAAPTKGDVLPALRALEGNLRRRGVASLYLFGSVLHGEAGPGSDIDLFVDVAPDRLFSLVDLVSAKDFVEEAIGRPVDLVVRGGLHPLLRDKIVAEAERVF
jgi:putative addiction module CopG family antidote